MKTEWYERMIKALQLNGKGERRQEAYARALRMSLGTLLTKLTKSLVFCARSGKWPKSKRPIASRFPLKAVPTPGPV